ncbi:putative GPI-anchored adhesin-like protein PGA55 isoform X2 [Penaeus vannamei]|uniref:Putative GPI-anchored adhesin-like protein PGA55 isoform X2 n=1 Tax=Penaeus vannamei TaxID=6689 RepID=A0A423TU41_PENVA|nr:putative GPI-anchored adhesin-like protein PGA55 isoform X2 [Penaeus vannamei]
MPLPVLRKGASKCACLPAFCFGTGVEFSNSTTAAAAPQRPQPEHHQVAGSCSLRCPCRRPRPSRRRPRGTARPSRAPTPSPRHPAPPMPSTPSPKASPSSSHKTTGSFGRRDSPSHSSASSPAQSPPSSKPSSPRAAHDSLRASAHGGEGPSDEGVVRPSEFIRRNSQRSENGSFRGHRKLDRPTSLPLDVAEHYGRILSAGRDREAPSGTQEDPGVSTQPNKSPVMNGKSLPFIPPRFPSQPSGSGLIKPSDVTDLQSVQLRKTETKVSRANNVPLKMPMSPEPAFTSAKDDVIAELKMGVDISGIKKMKSERAKEEERNGVMEKEELKRQFSAVNFVDQVPDVDNAGNRIPEWKRQMLARKAAERAKKEAEEQRMQEAEEKRLQAIPLWKRQLLMRREDESKRDRPITARTQSPVRIALHVRH